MARQPVAVSIAGHEYRVLSEGDGAWLQRVARQVDDTMTRIRRRTGTVDSYDVAVLAALNLARELVTLREAGVEAEENVELESERLRALIELAEAAADRPEPTPPDAL